MTNLNVLFSMNFENYKCEGLLECKITTFNQSGKYHSLMSRNRVRINTCNTFNRLGSRGQNKRSQHDQLRRRNNGDPSNPYKINLGAMLLYLAQRKVEY